MRPVAADEWRSPVARTEPDGVDRDLHRLAAELHDGLSQELFAAELDLHELRCLPDLPPAAREVLDRVGLRLSTGARQLRAALLATLDPEYVGEAGPAVAEGVQELMDSFVLTHRIAASLQVNGDGPDPGGTAGRVLLRTVREGLANVAKHAGASRVDVALHRDQRWWGIAICDDGSGDPEFIRTEVAAARSFGLCSIRTDAARIGGRLTVDAAGEGRGVRLCVQVPAGPAPDPTQPDTESGDLHRDESGSRGR
ncbi:MAG TPA: histidine kinase [Sporichthyaceae bacterium]|nr:histidine kinase [Sporichthyaceae bacterium]